jgi:hypothetical protein
MVKFLLEDNRKLQAADSFNKIFAFFRAVQVFRFTRVAVPLNARKTIPWRGKIIPDKPVDKNLPGDQRFKVVMYPLPGLTIVLAVNKFPVVAIINFFNRRKKDTPGNFTLFPKRVQHYER